MQFVHLTDDLRELILRELQEQLAVIDNELKALGVVPHEFDAAAPEATAPAKIEIVGRRRA